MLDRMAHEDLEVEIEEPAGGPEKRKKVKKAYAPLGEVQRVLRMSNQADASRLDRHLAALTRCNVLRLGMALKCDSCLNTSWFSLEDLRQTLNCPRCLTEFLSRAACHPRMHGRIAYSARSQPRISLMVLIVWRPLCISLKKESPIKRQ